MITVSEAYAKANQANPGRRLVEAMELSNGYYLFAMPRTDVEVDYADPYFAVNKSTGSVSQFVPTADIELFLSAKKIPLSQIQNGR